MKLKNDNLVNVLWSGRVTSKALTLVLLTIPLSLLFGLIFGMASSPLLILLVLAGIAFGIIFVTLLVVRPEIAIIIYTFISVNTGGFIIPLPIKYQVTLDVLITAMLLIGIVLHIIHRRTHIMRLPISLPFISFLMLSFATLFISPAPDYGFKASIRFLSYLLLAVIVFETFNSRRQVSRLVVVFLLSAVIPLIIGFCQLAFNWGEFVNIPLLGLVNRLEAFTGGSFTYSFYLMLMIFLIISVAPIINSRFAKIAAYIFLSLCAASLVLTYIRGAWLATIGGLLFLGFWRRRLLLPVLIICIGLIIYFVPNVVDRIASISLVQDTAQERLRLWQVAWSVFLKRPIFGYGLYAFAYGLNAEAQKVLLSLAGPGTFPANEYLQFLVDSGLVGTFLFYSMLAIIYKSAWRLSHSADKMIHALGEAMIIMGIGLALGGLTQNPLSSQPAVSIYFWIFASMILAVDKNIANQSVQVNEGVS